MTTDAESFYMRKHIYIGKVIEVFKDTVTLPNGNIAELDYIAHPGASAIVPITNDGKIILLKQYRHAASGYLYEIPAGKLDIQGENPLECAKRELQEETGYQAKEWKKLVTIQTTPGFCNEIIHIYLAKNLIEGKTAHEANEVIDIHYFTKEEIFKMMQEEKITDAKTLSGLFYALFNKL